MRELNEMLGELTNTESCLRNLITALEHGHPEIETMDEILANEVATFRRRSDAVVTVSAPSFQPDSASQAIAIKAVLRESLSKSRTNSPPCLSKTTCKRAASD